MFSPSFRNNLVASKCVVYSGGDNRSAVDVVKDILAQFPQLARDTVKVVGIKLYKDLFEATCGYQV